jgi:alpha-1,2-mannosyltransferase
MDESRASGSKTGLERWIVSFVTFVILAAILAPALAGINYWIALAAALACLSLISWFAHRLPVALRGGFKRRKLLSVVWFLLALIALLQFSRLSAFMADPTRTWGSTVPDPMAIGHQCMSAYVQAADLVRRDEKNIYDEKFYPAFSRKAGTELKRIDSPVHGLKDWLEDPYQYPPQFLILPRTALALSNNFLSIRTVWFVLQTLVLLVGGILFSKWIGGKQGILIGLLLPILFASMPMMFNLQFGQFHAITVFLAIAGMIAFEKQKTHLGGALLSFSILSKIFPALLLIYLCAQKRWRDIAWTAAFGFIFTILGLIILGLTPFHAFLYFELPRLINNHAFSFMDTPGTPIFLLARNYSIIGLVTKLRLLGFSGLNSVASSVLLWSYTLFIVWLALRAGTQTGERTHLSKALIWLALLNLAAMRTPLLPSAYGMAPFLFLLCLIATEIHGRIFYGVLLVLAWLLIMGAPPLPDTQEILFDLVSQLVALSINIWILLRRPLQPHAFPLKVSPEFQPA